MKSKLTNSVDASIVLIYENRYYVLYARDTYWARLRKPCLASIFIFNILLVQPPFFMIPDQPTAKKIVLEFLPCLPEYSFKGREMFILAANWELPLVFLSVGFFILTPPILVFFILTFYHLVKGKSTVSLKTQQLQRQLIYALSFQSSFLIATLLGPFIAVVTTMILQYHYQGLNNMIYVVLALHGIGSTIVMILVHKPYRDFTFSVTCGRFKNTHCDQPILFLPSFVLGVTT
uniref:Serpentine Receptor, class H n=1 Tax=Caenorhabditis japonica TaxID=281687 RepID=A0A8R1DP21_CAEJA